MTSRLARRGWRARRCWPAEASVQVTRVATAQTLRPAHSGPAARRVCGVRSAGVALRGVRRLSRSYGDGDTRPTGVAPEAGLPVARRLQLVHRIHDGRCGGGHMGVPRALADDAGRVGGGGAGRGGACCRALVRLPAPVPPVGRRWPLGRHTALQTRTRLWVSTGGGRVAATRARVDVRSYVGTRPVAAAGTS